MKRICLLLIFVLVILFSTIGQNNLWYFGDGNFLDFNTPSPTLTAAGIQIATPTTTYCIEGTSTMCDATGQLLFYSDGIHVWDKNFTQMPNGNGLTGHSSDAQVLIVPNPGNSNLYYIFYADYAGDTYGFSYSEVDMNLNGGLGDVTATKNIILHTPSAELMKAVTACNGTDIWVLSHDATGNTFRAYLVNSSGVNTTPVVSNVGSPFSSIFTGMSYMTCRKDGKKIAINNDATIEIFDFDNQNGILCPPITVQTGGYGGYGIEYSEDGTKLYVSDYNLYQFDVTSNNPSTIALSKATYSITEPGALMRGPDDKIYIAGGCDYYDTQTSTMYYARNVHVIQNPNLSGTAASNLLINAYTTQRECGIGLPTCYYPTQTSNTCGPVLTADASVSNNNICINDCVNYSNLSLGPAVSYDWTFQGGSPSTFSGLTPPQVCYASPGTYTTTLVIADCSGNTSTTNLSIIVSNCTSPIASFIPAQTSLCEGDCISFTDNSSGTNINSWNWTFAGGNPSTYNGQNPGTICFNSAGTYNINLSITDDNGSDDTTIIITVNACTLPTANFSVSNNNICEGDCITITDLSTGASSWEWTFTGGNPASSSTQNPGSVCYETAGNYTIQLITTNTIGSDTLISNIQVNSNSAVNAGNDVTISLGDNTNLSATGSSGTYTWSPYLWLSCLMCPDPIATPEETTTYTVSVTDANGCVATDNVTVYVDSKNIIFVPNIFSPNGDNHNDVLYVRGKGIASFNFYVFDRWGEKVFETSDLDSGWDGTVRGKPMHKAVFVYYLTVNFMDGSEIEQKGDITLIR